jgi:peptide/nickel transport system substrate-binding protein
VRTRYYDRLIEAFQRGKIDRRHFVNKMLALGIGGPLLLEILAACSRAAPTPTPAPAPTTAPTTSSTTSAAPTTAPASATGKRGGSGELKLLWWQAPTILNPHLGKGTKDQDASTPVFEPLAYFNQQGELTPRLAESIPSLDNGLVAKDGSSVTWKLRSGVLFHDGKPMTADDVVFTWQYVTDKATGSVSAGLYKNVSKVEATDDHTVKVTFEKPTPVWFLALTSIGGSILPRHAYEKYKGAASRTSPLNQAPIGTGPFKVKEFKPSDHVNYVAFDQYHEPGLPHFDSIYMKGGGDAESAARAVLQTGEFDWGWNIQAEPDVLAQMEKAGKGKVNITPGGSIERILLNYTDPNKTVDGERSSVKAPHPFFTDPKVRQAFGLAVQRDVIAKQLYGAGGRATANILNAPEKFLSKDTSWSFDLKKAADLLDQAGWTKGSDGIREKNGVKMSVLFATSTTPVRQKTQAIIKQALEQLGVKVELKATSSDVFFSADQANPDTFEHFYSDMEMYTSGVGSPDPQNFFLRWVSWEIAQKSNHWSGDNIVRYNNPDFDKIFNQALNELDPVKRGRLIVAMNDHVVNNVVEVPVVARNGVAVVVNSLTGYHPSTWESDLWDVREWDRKK